MATARAMDVFRTSATSTATAPAQFSNEVVKLIDVSKCIGCKACQSACIEWNDTKPQIGFNHGVYENPLDLTPEMFTVMRYAEYVNPDSGNLEWLIRKDGCMHCAEPGCLAACPAPGAIVQYTNGIVDFVADNCIGCGYCIRGCPFNIPRVSQAEGKAHKCTLCSDRVAVGQGPACQKACPTQAIVFGTKDEMMAHADGRIKDLKSRGFAAAGLYNPGGGAGGGGTGGGSNIGGTHVMYVLHHADKPEIYSGLAANPSISGIIGVWKGATKYVGLAALGAALVVAFFHHVVRGPNRVSREDEEKARRLVEGRA